MLVLTRRRAENTFLDFSGMTDTELLALRTAKPIKVAVVDVRGDKVRLGFDAPAAVQINREEIIGE
jgi:sRNA-binding carbon storage regulator CsrA